MSYRPHNSGHDYYDKGIYLITLVVGNRDRLLGELNMDVRNPSVSLSSLGSAVMDEWRKTAAIQASKRPQNHPSCRRLYALTSTAL